MYLSSGSSRHENNLCSAYRTDGQIVCSLCEAPFLKHAQINSYNNSGLENLVVPSLWSSGFFNRVMLIGEDFYYLRQC